MGFCRELGEHTLFLSSILALFLVSQYAFDLGINHLLEDYCLAAMASWHFLDLKHF